MARSFAPCLVQAGTTTAAGFHLAATLSIPVQDRVGEGREAGVMNRAQCLQGDGLEGFVDLDGLDQV